MLFTTQSGSTYEVNAITCEIRRLEGTHPTTQNQGVDGEWRHYTSISPLKVGNRVLVLWDQSDPTIMPRTITSPVVSLQESTRALRQEDVVLTS